MRIPLLLAFSLLLPAVAVAQQGSDHGPATTLEGGGVFPAGWQVRPDEGGTLPEVKIEAMAPGWHMTTAASGIIYRPTDRATGSYDVSAKLHLFPEGPGHQEAYGIFIGGKDLGGAGQRYTYFLLRGDGILDLAIRVENPLHPPHSHLHHRGGVGVVCARRFDRR